MERTNHSRTPASPSRRRLTATVTAALFAAAATFAAAAVGAQPVGAAINPGDTIEWRPERAPAGPTLIVVGLAEQRAQIYRNGVRIGSTPISSGKPGYATPTGLFSILEKKRMHHSNLYEDAPMPNMQRLTWDGVALHTGRVPGYPASHGCVRLPDEMSGRLFEVTTHGSLVAIVDSFPDTAVLDMRLVPTAGDTDPNEEAILPSAGAGTYGPVSIVLSTADAAIVVMRNGIEIGRADVEVEPGASTGEWVYVGRPGNVWEQTALQGNAPLLVSAESIVAGQLRVDPAFGPQLDAVLVPGTTVLITDRPLGLAALPPPVDAIAAAPLASDLQASVEVAP